LRTEEEDRNEEEVSGYETEEQREENARNKKERHEAGEYSHRVDGVPTRSV
jgi:hypothetical protein